MLAIRGSSDVSDHSAPEIPVAAWTNGGDPVFIRSVLKFDLSSIPASVRVISAKLSLYTDYTPLNEDLVHANYGANNTMFIQRVITPWQMTNVTWQTQPASEPDNQVIIPHTDQYFLDLNNIEVTSMVQKMVTSGNYGFMMRLQNEVTYTSRIFYSSKSSDATKHPRLVITYE
ncbi:MAG TPA: DNRLRE domain-containing protein [Candidatus Nitrosocosmicus sp.]